MSKNCVSFAVAYLKDYLDSPRISNENCYKKSGWVVLMQFQNQMKTKTRNVEIPPGFPTAA